VEINRNGVKLTAEGDAVEVASEDRKPARQCPTCHLLVEEADAQVCTHCGNRLPLASRRRR
jgi:rRNA maturation endonuclease Nob1